MSTPMTIKICHLISCLDVGGAEISLLRLLSAIDRKRFECSAVSLIEIGRVGERMKELGIPVESLRLKRGAVSAAGLFRLLRRLRRDRPGILMTWLYHSDLLGLMAGRLAGVPNIVWNLRASNVDMSRYRRLSGWTLRLCSRLSPLPTAVVANSESGRAFHAKIGYRPRSWTIIRNGVDHCLFRPDPAAREQMRKSLGIGPGDVVIGLVARLDPMKDHDNFMAAARAVAQAEKSARFVLAGKGVSAENGRLMPYVAEPPLAGRVLMLDERHDIPELLPAFDIACSSSFSEAFPNTMAEAMACAVPCVATDAGDSAEIIGETGIVVPPADPGALAKGLLRAIALGPSGRRDLGRAARERIILNFGLERFVGEYEALFLRLAEAR